MTAPPPSTRSATAKLKADFQYLMDEVLELDTDSPLVKAFRNDGIESIGGLLALSEQEIDDLTYDDNGTDRYVPKSQRSIVRILKAWNFYLKQKLLVNQVDWGDKAVINNDTFNHYRIGEYDPDNPRISLSSAIAQAALSSNPVAPTSSATAPSIANPTGPVKRSAAADFRKAIKLDKSHYKELRDEAKWDEWKRATLATVSSHGCDNIVNPAYVPTTQDEYELFLEHQKFMYDVFVATLKTDMGQHLVRTYEQIVMHKLFGGIIFSI